MNDDALSKTLQIHLIFDRIFDHLPYSNIVNNCSIVNKSWNAAVTHYLNNLSVFQVTARVNNNSPNLQVEVKERLKNYGNNHNPKYKSYSFTNETSIQDFQKKLSESESNKKIIWLSIHYDNNRNQNGPCDQLMRSFIDLTLPWVTRLSIVDTREQCCSSTDKVWTPIHPIYIIDHHHQNAPKFDHLCVGELLPEFKIWPATPCSIPVGTLGRIKILQFDPNYRHALIDNTKTILRACSNVESILYFPLDYIHTLNEVPDHQSKLRSINWHKLPLRADDDCTEKMDQLGAFSSQLQLIKLTISMVPSWTTKSGKNKKKQASTNWKKCCHNFSKILNSCSESIQKLEIWPLEIPQTVQWPVNGLPKLRRLVLVWTEAGKNVNGRGFFPQSNFQLQNIFPILNTLEITGLQDKNHRKDYYYEEILPSPIFGGGSNLVWLKKLKLRNKNFLQNFSTAVKFIERVAGFFPQIVILDIGTHPTWLVSCLPVIWKSWPKLEQLFISIEWSSNASGGSVQILDNNFYLDEAITGIPNEICSKIRQSGSNNQVENDEDFFKSVKSIPGISDMKHLQQLSMTFSGSFVKKTILFSEISVRYGFQLVPQLKVNFSVQSSPGQHKFSQDMTKVLEPIIPFINFDAEF